MSDVREQRLARIEEDVQHDFEFGRVHPDDYATLTFLLGEARRVPQLEAEREADFAQILRLQEQAGEMAEEIMRLRGEDG